MQACIFKLIVFIFFIFMEIIPPQTKFLGHLGIPLSVRLSVQFCHGKVQNSCPIHIFILAVLSFPQRLLTCMTLGRVIILSLGHLNKFKVTGMKNTNLCLFYTFLIEYDCFILHHKKIAYDLCHEMCNFNVIVWITTGKILSKPYLVMEHDLRLDITISSDL